MYSNLVELEGSDEEKVTQEDIEYNNLLRKNQNTADTKNALNYSNAYAGHLKTEMHRNERSRNFIDTTDACFACDTCTQTRKKTVCVIM